MAPIDFAYKYYAVCIPPKQQTLCHFLQSCLIIYADNQSFFTLFSNTHQNEITHFRSCNCAQNTA